MADEKKRILTMLSEGKISPEEAEKLLNAVDKQNPPKTETGKSFLDSMENKNLYVQVEPKEGKSSDKVSVKVPFGLLKAGLNVAGLIPQDAQDKINSSMNEKGINFNLNDMKPENIQELMTALEELSVDIDTEDAAIKVFCR